MKVIIKFFWVKVIACAKIKAQAKIETIYCFYTFHN